MSPESTLSTGQIHITNPNKKPGKKDSLFTTDVLHIAYVIDSGDPNVDVNQTMLNALAIKSTGGNATTTAVDITSRYELDNGQRDNYYDHAAIILKPGSPPPTGRILIIVDHFSNPSLATPVQDSAAGYFSVKSYGDVDVSTPCKFNLAGASRVTFALDTIPAVSYTHLTLPTIYSV